jgi:hypothetical protein
VSLFSPPTIKADSSQNLTMQYVSSRIQSGRWACLPSFLNEHRGEPCILHVCAVEIKKAKACVVERIWRLSGFLGCRTMPFQAGIRLEISWAQAGSTRAVHMCSNATARRKGCRQETWDGMCSIFSHGWMQEFTIYRASCCCRAGSCGCLKAFLISR